MLIGVPTEIKVAEKRVGITPAGVKAMTQLGHRVMLQKGAGLGSGFLDESYRQAGAEVRQSAEMIWADSEMIMKVKEPIGNEFALMHERQILFTYLHLAADKVLTEKLMNKKIIGIAYETIQTDRGKLPLLAPMSAVAGRLSIQAGAFCLEAKNGGMGILLSGVPGVKPARIAILGAGVSGMHSCISAVGSGAQVSVFDINPERLSYISEIMNGRVSTLMSSPESIEEELTKADLVVCSVLIPGATAPKLITRDLLKQMKPGSAVVDISIDQGGCCETSHPTTHEAPTFIEEGIVHYCVANMPGAVPRTSTIALTNVTMPYAIEIANKGYVQAVKDNSEIAKGMNLIEGQVVYPAVAESLSLQYVSSGDLM